MNIFLEGVILGFSLAFLFGFGPAFFALIQTGIHRGFWPGGALLAFGIFLNDAVIVLLTLIGATQILSGADNYKLLGIIGGVLLIIFGIWTYRNKSKMEQTSDSENNKEPHALIYIAKGFIMNVANPFVWLFWLSVVVGITARYEADKTDLFLFFSGTLSIVFVTDLIKAFMASRLKKFVTDKFLILVNKIAGVGLVGFGVFLIIRSFVAF